MEEDWKGGCNGVGSYVGANVGGATAATGISPASSANFVSTSGPGTRDKRLRKILNTSECSCDLSHMSMLFTDLFSQKYV